MDNDTELRTCLPKRLVITEPRETKKFKKKFTLLVFHVKDRTISARVSQQAVCTYFHS